MTSYQILFTCLKTPDTGEFLVESATMTAATRRDAIQNFHEFMAGCSFEIISVTP